MNIAKAFHNYPYALRARISLGAFGRLSKKSVTDRTDTQTAPNHDDDDDDHHHHHQHQHNDHEEEGGVGVGVVSANRGCRPGKEHWIQW